VIEGTGTAIMDQTPSTPSESGQGQPPGEVTEALVRQVAERVYRMLLQELKYEHERLRLVSKKAGYRKGGR
jgi:hypothetical protein